MINPMASRMLPHAAAYPHNIRQYMRVDELAARFVAPFYLDVLHGNLTGLGAPEQTTLRDGMRSVAADISLDVAQALWAVEEWRCNIMASWWATVWGWPEAVTEVERLLIPSRLTYSGQGHCVALAGLSTPEAGRVLVIYLDTYLPRADLVYNQGWAMSALSIVDEALGSSLAAERLPMFGVSAPDRAGCQRRWAEVTRLRRSARWDASERSAVGSPRPHGADGGVATLLTHPINNRHSRAHGQGMMIGWSLIFHLRTRPGSDSASLMVQPCGST
jgi:hypothetical protein